MKTLSVISGFLGSGKTTLLNRLLRDPCMEATAVLINELGDVGIDNLIVDEFDDDIVLLESGCVCCSVRDDLTASLLKLASRSENGDIPFFDNAVLETTGIADPASILQLLMSDEFVCKRYRLGSVITVVDACYGLHNLEEFPEASRQVLMADRLVISKTDLVGKNQERRVRRELEHLNPLAPQYRSTEASARALFAAAPARDDPPRMAGLRHQHSFETFQLGWERAVDWSTIETWIEGLLSARGDDIFRIKGIVNIADEIRPTVFQSVQHSVYAPSYLANWPGGNPHTELTFIAQHFSKTAALSSLRPFVDLPADA